MVLDFALSYSDDWFLLPMALDAWSLFDATEVAVTDVFGDVTVAEPPAGRWNLFRLDSSGTRFTLSKVFVAAGPAEAIDGPSLEEVHFLADEVANVAWGSCIANTRLDCPLLGFAQSRSRFSPARTDGASATICRVRSGTVWRERYAISSRRRSRNDRITEIREEYAMSLVVLLIILLLLFGGGGLYVGGPLVGGGLGGLILLVLIVMLLTGRIGSRA